MSAITAARRLFSHNHGRIRRVSCGTYGDRVPELNSLFSNGRGHHTTGDVTGMSAWSAR